MGLHWVHYLCGPIAPDKRGYPVELFLHGSIHCGYSLEASCRVASNEYPECRFLWRNKTDINCFFCIAELLLCMYDNVYDFCKK